MLYFKQHRILLPILEDYNAGMNKITIVALIVLCLTKCNGFCVCRTGAELGTVIVSGGTDRSILNYKQI